MSTRTKNIRSLTLHNHVWFFFPEKRGSSIIRRYPLVTIKVVHFWTIKYTYKDPLQFYVYTMSVFSNVFWETKLLPSYLSIDVYSIQIWHCSPFIRPLTPMGSDLGTWAAKACRCWIYSNNYWYWHLRELRC